MQGGRAAAAGQDGCTARRSARLQGCLQAGCCSAFGADGDSVACLRHLCSCGSAHVVKVRSVAACICTCVHAGWAAGAELGPPHAAKEAGQQQQQQQQMHHTTLSAARRRAVILAIPSLARTAAMGCPLLLGAWHVHMPSRYLLLQRTAATSASAACRAAR
jgi:hypothetical protein